MVFPSSLEAFPAFGRFQISDNGGNLYLLSCQIPGGQLCDLQAVNWGVKEGSLSRERSSAAGMALEGCWELGQGLGLAYSLSLSGEQVAPSLSPSKSCVFGQGQLSSAKDKLWSGNSVWAVSPQFSQQLRELRSASILWGRGQIKAATTASTVSYLWIKLYRGSSFYGGGNGGPELLGGDFVIYVAIKYPIKPATTQNSGLQNPNLVVIALYPCGMWFISPVTTRLPSPSWARLLQIGRDLALLQHFYLVPWIGNYIYAYVLSVGKTETKETSLINGAVWWAYHLKRP